MRLRGWSPELWEQRFHARVDRSGGPDACWPWLGARARGKWPYGTLSGFNREHLLAHRVAWTLAHGPVPEGHRVLHHCDNPPCCNPYGDRHLFTGTAMDNSRDMAAKGRAGLHLHPELTRGECNPNAKLTDNDAREILRSVQTPLELSLRFGVSRTVIYSILAGRRWKHVDVGADAGK